MLIRIIRRLCVVLFVLALLAYVGLLLYNHKTTDSTGPKISMESTEVTVSVSDGDDAILAGVTAYDTVDGDVTELLVVESLSNFISDGVREATIAAFDASGNVTKQTRTVIYSDYTSPRVSLSGPLAASTSDSTALLEVISIVDCLDGDLADSMQIVFDDSSQSVAEGEYAMHIQVSNSAGDTVDLPVTVRFYTTVEERNAPQITLTEYLVYLSRGESLDPTDYLDTMVIGSDTYNWQEENQYFFLDTEMAWYASLPLISLSSLTIEDNIDTTTAGTYEVTYRYEYNDEVTGITRLVVVVE